jgi:hypothetical protein
MGRDVLTGTDERTALDFLYAHNGTNLLIDSTDIGKYSAFSSIGSNANYDKYSWIPTVIRDEKQTQETNNETIYVYPIGTVLDEDVLINTNNKTVLLPRRNAAVAAVALREGTNGEILQPTIFYVYNQQQYSMPMRYVYINNTLYDFKSGINAGIFTFTRIDQTSTGSMTIVPAGAALYLSNRTVDSELAKLYLFNEKSDYIKLEHTEQDLLISNLRSQGATLDDFVYYQGLRGPIKIWQISYPSDIKLNTSYLSTEYPAELQQVTPGLY